MAKKEIIGYYDYYYDEYEYTRKGKGKGEVYVDKPANDIRKMFYGDKLCPFCSTKLEKVFLGIQSAPRDRDLFFEGRVFECPKCGWWTYKTHFSDAIDSYDEIHDICTDKRYYAITKSYDISDKQIPIEILTAELKKKTDLIYDIAPYKLEELAQSILRGVYDCEVHHVGKTGDGGKDLIVLESDSPILVQVKRRQNPDHVELIKGVREFVGTLYIENERKGIYITTAKRFSRGCEGVKKVLLDNRKLDYFEFVNYDKLCYWLGEKEEEKRWKKLVSEFEGKEDAVAYIGKGAVEKFEKECEGERLFLLAEHANEIKS